MSAVQTRHLWPGLSRAGIVSVTTFDTTGYAWDGPNIHRHRQISAVVAVEGTVRLELGPRQHHDFATGEVALVGPWIWHAHPPPRTGVMAIIGRRHHDLDVCLMWPGGEEIVLVPLPPGELATAALAAGARPAEWSRLLAWLAAATPCTDPSPAALRRMSEFLWKHRTSPVGAAAVLASSGLGYSAANRLFREHFGVTAKQYLLHCRLELAERLLRDGHQPGDIWAQCGFASRADLSRRFRLTRGSPPRQWARPDGGRRRKDLAP